MMSRYINRSRLELHNNYSCGNWFNWKKDRVTRGNSRFCRGFIWRNALNVNIWQLFDFRLFLGATWNIYNFCLCQLNFLNAIKHVLQLCRLFQSYNIKFKHLTCQMMALFLHCMLDIVKTNQKSFTRFDIETTDNRLLRLADFTTVATATTLNLTFCEINVIYKYRQRNNGLTMFVCDWSLYQQLPW